MNLQFIEAVIVSQPLRSYLKCYGESFFKEGNWCSSSPYKLINDRIFLFGIVKDQFLILVSEVFPFQLSIIRFERY